jgi:hypothetical protein
VRGAWRRALAWERGDSCTDPANLLGIHLPCTPLATCDLLGFADALYSALTACNFFLGRQEKVTKKKATPALRARLCRVPCATRAAGRLRNSGLRPSDSPRRGPPAPLRCSALHEGEEKHTERNLERGLNLMAVDVRLVFNHPFASSSSARRNGKKGEDCLRGRRSEFRSPPVAAEQRRAPGAAGRRGGRAFFLGTSSWQDKKKYARASGAEPRRRSPSWHKEPAR